ncbi:MAG: amidohydrolase family protein [Bacteroidetes bacterium]|nr:amidohydrolase family protein [Bacteroidota bacterium]
MIIDTHHHLWSFNEADYGWMDDSMKILKRDYLPSDLQKELEKTEVSGTVVVQARQVIEETRWLLEQADANPFIKGVVGWVDLRSPELVKQLEEFAAHPKLVGVRHVIHDEADDDFMLRPAFVKGIEKLKDFNLTYDLLLFPRHLERAVELVSMFPDQHFALDHISKPDIESGSMQPWKDDIETLAAQSNVWCKISGMVTEANLDSWKYEDFVPYMKVVCEAFGNERIMLGTDWPVCRLGAEYPEVMKIPEKFFSPLSEREKENIYSQNAIDCYQLKPDN